MPRRSLTVPAYRLHKASGQARVILNGNHIYLGLFGSEKSHEKYARLIATYGFSARQQRSNFEWRLIAQAMN